LNNDAIKYYLTRFLKEMDFDLAQFTGTTDRALEERSTQIWNAYVLDSTVNAYGLKYLPMCCRISHMTYQGHPLDVKAYCAVYTLFHVLMDPQDHVGVHKVALCDLERFVLLSGNAKEMTHPMLGPFARFLLSETALSFSPIQTVGLFKSSLDYLLGCLCEQKFPQGVPSSTEDFPGWLRYKTGLGEPYAYFFLSCVEKEKRDHYLPVVPLITEYIQYVNDILSIYKEHCDSEGNNYASHASHALSIGTDDAMIQLAEKVQEIKRKIIHFGSENNILDISLKLIKGYIAWHITEDRYRLREIGIVMTNASDHAEAQRSGEGAQAS
jgi:hypothetical protein